jgi:hypothetical protein
MFQAAEERCKRQAIRDELWKTIRRLKTFSFNQICDEAGQQSRRRRRNVTEYLTGLAAAGYLQRQPGAMYALVKDAGVDTPHVRRDGTEHVQGKRRLQIWSVLSILKEFSPRDVAVWASTEAVPVSESVVREYLKYLHKAGYVIETRAGRSGLATGTGGQIRYRFLQSKYTGPKAPSVRKRVVFDENLGKVVWSRDGGLL